MQKKHNKEIVSTARMLRKCMTKEERHLWYDFLKGHPVKFLRQKIIGNYIVDFYCAQAKLAVELDGSGHDTAVQIQYDAERTAFLEEYGITVIRIPNIEIQHDFSGSCEYINRTLQELLGEC